MSALAMVSRSERTARLMERAEKRFASHVVRQTWDRMWLVGRPEGGSNDAYIVTATPAGEVIVSGDLDVMVFARGASSEANGLVSWIGRGTDVEYYVRQKALIGMTSREEFVDEWDDEVARWDVLEAAYYELELPMPDRVTSDDAEELAGRVSRKLADLVEFVARDTGDMRSEMDELLATARGYDCELGMDWGLAPSRRLVTAHAAVRRLRALLEEATTATARAGG